jgi:outer membrane protein
VINENVFVHSIFGLINHKQTLIMKKIILSAIAICAFGFANAQDKGTEGFTKGSIYASGTLSSKSVKGGDSSSEFSPAVGYFVSDNISVEGMFSTVKNGDAKGSGFGVGAAYHFNAANQFSTHVDLDVMVGSTDDGAGAKAKYNDIALGYGFNYFVSSHFALHAEIAAITLSSMTPDGGEAVKTTEIGLNTENISIGLTYKF